MPNEKIRYPGENVSKTRLEILYVMCSSSNCETLAHCTLKYLYVYDHIYMLQNVVLFSAKNTNFYFMLEHLNHDEALTTYWTTWTAPMPSQSPNAPPLTVMNCRGENGG